MNALLGWNFCQVQKRRRLASPLYTQAGGLAACSKTINIPRFFRRTLFIVTGRHYLDIVWTDEDIQADQFCSGQWFWELI
jgi:hypothetical protein